MRITTITNPSRFPAVQFAISSFPHLFTCSRLHSVPMASNGTPLVDDNTQFGFQRQEMYSEKLSGTAIAYDRHVILCYKTHDEWPSRVESSDNHPFPKLLAAALKARKNDIPVKTLLTICEGREGTELSEGDVLLFPEMVKYRGLKESDINSFVDEVIVNRKPWSTGVQESMTGSHIFVCAHSSRDKRCGFCGPILIKKFKEEIEQRGLENVSVTACSHVGGHKYAGNLIIYSIQDKKVHGDWYGYVTPNDVPDLLDLHIGNGKIIERIWRGQMGTPPVKKAQKPVEPKLPNGNDLNLSPKDNNGNDLDLSPKDINGNDLNLSPKDNPTNCTKEEKENGGSCCQGVNGFSCCRDEKPEAETETEKEEGLKKLTRKLDDFLTKKWERYEIFTAAAVAGAVVTVVVAYSFYRRSR